MSARDITIIILGCIIFGLIFIIDSRSAETERVLKEQVTREVDDSAVIVSEPSEQTEDSSNEENALNTEVAPNIQPPVFNEAVTEPTADYYPVVKVVDGDTIDVVINNKTERLRLIGINTPETVDPRKPVECFGKEASNKAKELLAGQTVALAGDVTQDERDKYGRLLRYVWREDGLFFNLEIVKQGFAYEYTYNLPYKYQTEFKNAQGYARVNKLGLWADGACALTDITTNTPPASVASSSCAIKGNISYSTKEKIYHVPGCDYYTQTKIDIDSGEQYFCSEEEALAAGWRKALNCP